MADEPSTTPPVSELAAQLASHIANKPLGPASGSSGGGSSARPPARTDARPDARPDRGPRENRPPREGGRPPGQGGKPGSERPPEGAREARREPRPEGRPAGGPTSDRSGGPAGDRGSDRGARPAGGRFDFPQDIDLEKLIQDSLYLDNQAHAVVVRIRDMDSGTRSTLRRLYNSVRRATRAPENERQHEFVMLRARLAYTIARHGLRSLDQIERLLLQVTRKNEARGYERFRDLFEAIVAYNE